MTFYALFPLLSLLFMSRLRGSPAWLAGGIAVSLILDLVVQQVAWSATGVRIANNSFLYYNIVNQLPVFLIGMLVYAGVRDGAFRPSPVRDAALLVLFVALAAWLLHVSDGVAAILLPSAMGGASAFLLNLLRHRSAGVGLIERIGQLSFSMYVFHFVFAGPVTSILGLRGNFFSGVR